jgi:Uma2 family endonuclease
MPTALRKQISIGPNDHGRRMSLDRFDRAIAKEGMRYELHNGIIEATEIPHPRHLAQLGEVRDQLTVFLGSQPGLVYAVTGAGESKVMIAPAQSECHPDLSVYLSPPPEIEDVWSVWIPEIVIEVVSSSSARRDYQDKPAEYLEFGINEYWIVDARKQQMTALTRWRGQWKSKIVKATQKYSTRQLPGFTLDVGRVVAAGK